MSSSTGKGELQPLGDRTMKEHFVYILKCRNGELYTGYTVDPETRLRLHNNGIASKYTRGRLPIKLVHLEKYPSKSAALKREAAIKKLSRLEKVRFCWSEHHSANF